MAVRLRLVILWLVGVWLWLALTSPELSYDEAAYAAGLSLPWRDLWATDTYTRHEHGAWMIYLAKLGQVFLPAGWLSIETRLRLPGVLLGSLAPVVVWLITHRLLHRSTLAAWVAASLLLGSVIRLSETNIIGPNPSMLLWTLAVVGVGLVWREKRTLATTVALGGLLALAGVTMTYVFPLTTALTTALALSSLPTLFKDRRATLRTTVAVVGVGLVMGLGMTLLWPPSILQNSVWNSFVWFATTFRSRGQPTLLHGVVEERLGPSAYFDWLISLDLPLLLVGGLALGWTLWRATQRHYDNGVARYLLGFVLVLIGVAVSAHVAGSRNLLQVLGVVCVLVGLAFDPIVLGLTRHRRLIAPVIIGLSVVNLAYQTWLPTRIPYLAVDGFATFVTSEGLRLAEPTPALVSGSPILRFYAAQAGQPIGWRITELPWSAEATTAQLSSSQYALLTEFVYGFYPPSHPARRVIVETWDIVWEYKKPHTYGVRLYRRR